MSLLSVFVTCHLSCELFRVAIPILRVAISANSFFAGVLLFAVGCLMQWSFLDYFSSCSFLVSGVVYFLIFLSCFFLFCATASDTPRSFSSISLSFIGD